MTLPSPFRRRPSDPVVIKVWGTMACGHRAGYERLTRHLLGDTWLCPLCAEDRQLVARDWVFTGWMPVPRYR